MPFQPHLSAKLHSSQFEKTPLVPEEQLHARSRSQHVLDLHMADNATPPGRISDTFSRVFVVVNSTCRFLRKLDHVERIATQVTNVFVVELNSVCVYPSVVMIVSQNAAESQHTKFELLRFPRDRQVVFCNNRRNPFGRLHTITMRPWIVVVKSVT